MIGENQNHADAAQAVERGQMSLASFHHAGLSELRAPPSFHPQTREQSTMTARTNHGK